MLSRLFFTTL